MKKSIYFIILSVIIGLILFGFFSVKIFNEVYGIKNCDDKFIEDYNKAILEKDVNLCKEEFFNRGYIGHSEPSCKTKNSKIINTNTCMVEIIQKHQDITLCEEFYSAEECFSELTNLKENPALCEELSPDFKLRCQEFIANIK